MKKKRKKSKLTLNQPSDLVRIRTESQNDSALRLVARAIIESTRQQLCWENLLGELRKVYPTVQVYPNEEVTAYSLDDEPFLVLYRGFPAYRVSDASDELPPALPDIDYWRIQNKRIAGWRVLRVSESNRWLEVALRAAAVVQSETKPGSDR